MADSNLMTRGRHIRSTNTAISRYVRNEFNDQDCRWLVREMAYSRCGAVKLSPGRKMRAKQSVSSTFITKLAFVMKGLTSSMVSEK